MFLPFVSNVVSSVVAIALWMSYFFPFLCFFQAVYVPADDLTDPAPATTFSHLTATTVLSRGIAELGIYPAVDPLESTSRILDPKVIGEDHYQTASKVKKLLQVSSLLPQCIIDRQLTCCKLLLWTLWWRKAMWPRVLAITWIAPLSLFLSELQESSRRHCHSGYWWVVWRRQVHRPACTQSTAIFVTTFPSCWGLHFHGRKVLHPAADHWRFQVHPKWYVQQQPCFLSWVPSNHTSLLCAFSLYWWCTVHNFMLRPVSFLSSVCRWCGWSARICLLHGRHAWWCQGKGPEVGKCIAIDISFLTASTCKKLTHYDNCLCWLWSHVPIRSWLSKLDYHSDVCVHASSENPKGAKLGSFSLEAISLNMVLSFCLQTSTLLAAVTLRPAEMSLWKLDEWSEIVDLAIVRCSVH